MTAQHGNEVLAAARARAPLSPGEWIGARDDTSRLAAAQMAGAHAFVTDLPEGYRTPVGDGGIVLTEGQQLRLDLAARLASDSATHLRAGPIGGSLEVPKAPAPPKDPALPSLACLLDVQEMSHLLGGRFTGWDGMTGSEPEVRVQSVRYKPGDNLVVQYGVQSPSGWCTAVAYASAGFGLSGKITRRRNRRLVARVADRVAVSPPLTYFDQMGALVQWLPLDLRLPVLADTGQRLSERLAKKGIVAGPVQPELLRYWPRRRAVVRFGAYVLKLYRERDDFDQARRALRAASAFRRVHSSTYTTRLKAQRVTVQAWVPGHTPSLRPASSDSAGSLLADLHAEHLPRLPITTPRDILTKAARRTAFVTHLLPELAPELDALLSDLTAKARQEGPTVTSHGNFHAGQMLRAPGRLTLIDVDRLCQASPSYDLASFAAHVAHGRPGDRDVVDAAVESLIAGYGSRPPDLDWYLSTCLLRRAAVPFRFQDEEWPDAAARLVKHARAVLR